MTDLDEARKLAAERRALRKSWTLEQGLVLCRQLEPLMAEVGWHVALTGSVLYAGKSAKDLDILLMPHCKPEPPRDYALAEHVNFLNKSHVRRVLTELGWRLVMTIEQIHDYWRLQGSVDTKEVESWFTAERKRVDVFYVS